MSDDEMSDDQMNEIDDDAEVHVSGKRPILFMGIPGFVDPTIY